MASSGDINTPRGRDWWFIAAGIAAALWATSALGFDDPERSLGARTLRWSIAVVAGYAAGLFASRALAWLRR